MKLWGAAWMLALLVWLPFEDTQVWLAAALAAAACGWLAARVRLATWWHAALVGASVGAGTPLLAIGLMAFKSGLHGHGFADFTARQVWSVLSWLPASTLAFLIGGVLFFAATRLSVPLRVK